MFVALDYGVARGDVGAYENAWRLSLVLMLVGRSISTTLFPQISQWDTENATEKIESAIPTALFPSLLIVIPGFVGTLILSEDLLRVLFGREFTVAAAALIILVAGKIPQSLHILLSQALNAIDRPDLAAIAATTSAVLNLVLNVVLIWQYSLVGAAIATTVSFTVNTLLHAYFLDQFLEIKIPLRQAGWSVIASVVMGLCVFVARSMVEPTGMVQLLGIILFGIMIYSPVLLIYEPVRTQTTRIGGRLVPD
jgi:O-antigen/teichoic acid export membrane protein